MVTLGILTKLYRRLDITVDVPSNKEVEPMIKQLNGNSEIKKVMINENYGWIPHFDFNNGLTSSLKKDFKEVHITGASVTANGDVNFHASFDNFLNQTNQKNKPFGINIISVNPNDSSAFLHKEPSEFFAKIKEFKKYTNFKSVNINIENILASDKELYLGVLKDFKDFLHSYGLQLFVTVYPKTAYQYSTYTADIVKSYKSIAENADKLVIMFYDFHKLSASESRSTSPFSWLEQELKRLKAELDQDLDKVTIGMPLFGYGFNISSNSLTTSYTYDQITKISSNFSKDEIKQENFIQRGNERIYFLDEDMIKLRQKLANEYGINKFFYWRLGGDGQGV
jgi:spore germination protein YaaH